MSDCERVASFRVRAHRGLNRIPFRGRVRGRPLPEGAYRLVFRALGSNSEATVTVVVAHGKANAAALRRARRDESCSGASVTTGSSDTAATSTGDSGLARPKSDSGGDSVVVTAAKGVTRKAREAAGKARDLVTDSAPVNPILVVLFGLTALTSALLGLYVAVQMIRQYHDGRLR